MWTLHWPAAHGLTQLCVTLLASGRTRHLDTNNNLRLTPVACIHNYGHGQLATMLMSHMSTVSTASNVATDSDGYLIPHMYCSCSQFAKNKERANQETALRKWTNQS